MKKNITTTIEEYTNEALLSLDNLSFFTDEEIRNSAFRNVDILQEWGDIRDPQNVIEEDLLRVCSKPEEMQQYFSLMLSQMPKCSMLNKYDERFEAYKERFGNELGKQAESLIEWLGISLDALMWQLLKVGKKYGLNNPYEETWLNELRDTFEQTDNTGQKPTSSCSDLENILPEQLKTDEALKIFQRAIDANMMEKTAIGLKWLQIGKKGCKTQLAYFCGKLCGYENGGYKGNVGDSVSYGVFEKLFNETRLDRALAQCYEVKKPQWWRDKIDAIFF